MAAPNSNAKLYFTPCHRRAVHTWVRRNVARAPSLASSAQPGRDVSGVLISAMRIFAPRSQKVSPSTTQLIRLAAPHLAKATSPLDAASAWAGTGPASSRNGRMRARITQSSLRRSGGCAHSGSLLTGEHLSPGNYAAAFLCRAKPLSAPGRFRGFGAWQTGRTLSGMT